MWFKNARIYRLELSEEIKNYFKDEELLEKSDLDEEKLQKKFFSEGQKLKDRYFRNRLIDFRKMSSKRRKIM